MDRLRALQYFIASADAGSLSGAARKLEVSIPAVAKLVNVLEKDLGVALFERSAHGLILTTAGEDYLASCRPAVEQLHEVDEQVRGSSVRARGTVVIGVQHFIAQTIVAPALPRFHARHPEIQVDFREATQITNADAPGIDLFVSLGWPKAPDLIHRSVPMSRFMVCAAPAYWANHGMPRHPRELADHNCFQLRTQTGTVMDLWHFQRGDEKVSVTVKGWAVANNAHRDAILQLAAAGEGVVRVLRWASHNDVLALPLVPALTDWTLPDAPPVNLSFRPSARRVARVRALIDFILEIFRDLERDNAQTQRVARAPPHWANVQSGKASATRGRGAGRM
jgi:DNA-binding transcriptional LysR family regulator